MYQLDIPNFAKELISSISSEQVDRIFSQQYEEIVNQIKMEINPNQQSQFSGFWWEENAQRASYWFIKIQMSWNTSGSNFDKTHVFLNNLFETEEIDLSFQNGLMGLLLWLGRENEMIKDLVIEDFIEKATQFLLSKKMKLNANWKQFSFFPEAFDEDTWTSNNTLSWTVGDLHLVKLFYRQSKGDSESKYYEIAENIGLHSTTRVREEQTQITDSSLANGSIGLVVLYNALYQETGQEAYLKSSQYWRMRTEKFLEIELQNGYYAGREDNILDGLAGILMVFQELEKEEISPLLTYLAG
ncbi:lanthionine synthetase-like protein [Arcicella aurantiaca]|uniref:Lanthionine synthetase-like protein n=1 Tax=Arcicella aurantiaca TaxID=591202 RepID=A0A316E2M3_9BACT|nr:lanthionine synthetase LanC family protein [Arcicella aurantiaca]PWK23898.1 lanthionine synthetase-like protein [Arcicella aurantiaca]